MSTNSQLRSSGHSRRRYTRSSSWPRRSASLGDGVVDSSSLKARTPLADGIPKLGTPYEPVETTTPEVEATNINNTQIAVPTYPPRHFLSKVSQAGEEWSLEKSIQMRRRADCIMKQFNKISKINGDLTKLDLKYEFSKSLESDDEEDNEGAAEEKPFNSKIYVPATPIDEAILDELMALTGLEKVKEKFLSIKWKVDICKRQKAKRDKERFHAIFQGNPGTGKTTVARIYAKFLHALGMIPSNTVWETSGAILAFKGPDYLEQKINCLNSGGVIFVDEAYQLTAPHSSSAGRQALDFLLTEMENKIGKIVVIFVGYRKEMESFYEHNPGLASRIPYTVQFDDFDDAELLSILKKCINKKYSGQMQVEGGLDGLYMRMVIRRLGRQRDTQGFGNARAVENLLEKISERQAHRLRKEQGPPDGIKKRKKANHLTFTKEDLIGPDPSEAILNSDAWVKLQAMVGLDNVKRSAQNMIETVQANYIRELREQGPLEFTLNRVFFGSPGTGKTTVAKLYGQILADVGMLSNGEVVIKNPADFIGPALGQSEARTKAILAATAGKVLIIDEAYGLHTNGSKNGNSTDIYKSSVIDTLVAEIQAVPGDDRCVLLLGYEHELLEMFQYANPGLARRFAIEDPFSFVDYNLPQLEKMLYKKMQEQDLHASPQTVAAAMNIIDRARMRPNFSNGGEVNICLDRAKQNYLSRQGKKPMGERSYDGVLIPADFDPDFNRINTDSTCRKYLQGTVSTEIIELLEGYQKIASSARAAEFDPRELIPTRFIFKGPAGTGKTTAARSMGRIFYDMGFLSTKEVIECSSADLIGQFVGSTAPKTKAKLSGALGKVLLIDDAYRLGEGQFGTEAVTEMLHLLSSPQYMGKIVVILAGHTKDMNQLMSSCPNLCGLFPEEILFENIDADASMAILKRDLEESRIHAPDLKQPLSPKGQMIRNIFSVLRGFQSWSNARDIKNLAKQISVAAYKRPAETVQVETSKGRVKRLLLPPSIILECMEKMIKLQTTRAEAMVEEALRSKERGKNAINQAMDFAYDHQEHRTVDIDVAPDVTKLVDTPAQTDATNASTRTNAEAETVSETKNKKKKDLRQLLAKLGPCEMGYEWEEVAGGYRCRGGGHFLSIQAAERLCFGH